MGKKSVYQLPSETLPGLKLSHHVEDLSAVRDFIRSRGTETRNTRIERYLAYLQQAAGESTIDAAKILGHASYKTTEQVYTRFHAGLRRRRHVGAGRARKNQRTLNA
jgi:hypothetical protein